VDSQKTPHVDDPASVGRRLRDARRAAGLNQRELAGGACSAGYISRVELGDRIPSLQLLRVLGKRLGVSADYLATGTSGTESGDVVEAVLVDAQIALRLDDGETARRLFEEALEQEVRGQARVDALAGLGQLALREGENERAVELLNKAAEASGRDAAELPSVAEGLARAYAACGELGPAIGLLERCVSWHEETGDVLAYIRFASLLGYALTDTGDYGAAERIVGRALARGHDVIDPYARARLLWSQSRLLTKQGQVSQAERYARQTLETLRATEDNYAIAHALELLAHIYLELGRPTEAMELLDEGQPLISAAGTPSEIAQYRVNRARTMAALGDHEGAASLAMEVTGQLDGARPIQRTRAYLLIGDLFREFGDTARAQELYELAIESGESHPPGQHLVAAYRALAGILKERDHRDEALELLEKALAAQEGLARAAPAQVR
jgi:tetratricopeptide (TPR) repeat protein